MIHVTQPFLPPEAEYKKQISKIWETRWLTNHGQFVQSLEKELAIYLNTNTLHYVSSGTMALQLALRALDIKGEVITTPFSFVATTTTIIWQSSKPVFVDILPDTLCIDADKIEEAITEETSAILATHVFGVPCDVDKIEEIAKKYNLKVIYDAAHAFDVGINEKSLLNYGDLSVVSFHATKLFHTVEGGGIINNTGNAELDNKLIQLRNFGIDGLNHHLPGINGKNSEFHAAMGLSNLKYIDGIIREREEITNLYDSLLMNSKLIKPSISEDVKYNFAYYPVIFPSEEQLLQTMSHLKNNGINTRRYFYPSLNKLPYLKEYNSCVISEDISQRILCLPLYNGLTREQVNMIATHILESIK